MLKSSWNRLVLWLSALLLAGGLTAVKASAEEVEAGVKTSGYDSGFYIQSADEKFKLNIGGYIQGLAQGDMIDSGPGSDTVGVRRARLRFSGNIYSKNVKYVLEYDFSSNKMLTTMIQLVYSDAFKFQIGQYEVPFNIEALIKTSSQQFVDRSLAYSVFGVADQREPGLGFEGRLLDKKLEYGMGAFDGEGLNTANTNKDLRWVGRLAYNLMGEHGGTFCDIKPSETPSVLWGVAGMFNNTFDPTATFEQETASFTTDLSAKYRGWGMHGAFFYRHLTPDVGTEADDKGFTAQVGYLVIPETLEVAARVSQVLPDAGGDKGEYTAGVNYYIFDGHRVKLQLDYSVLTTENGIAVGNDRADQRVRAQLQVRL